MGSSRRRVTSPYDEKLDSAGCIGEPAREWRSLNLTTGGVQELRGSVLKHCVSASGGWRKNGGKGRVRQAGRTANGVSGVHARLRRAKEPIGGSQSVHSSEEGPVMGLEPRDAGRWIRCVGEQKETTDINAERLNKSERVRARTVCAHTRMLTTGTCGDMQLLSHGQIAPPLAG